MVHDVLIAPVAVLQHLTPESFLPVGEGAAQRVLGASAPAAAGTCGPHRLHGNRTAYINNVLSSFSYTLLQSLLPAASRNSPTIDSEAYDGI